MLRKQVSPGSWWLNGSCSPGYALSRAFGYLAGSGRADHRVEAGFHSPGYSCRTTPESWMITVVSIDLDKQTKTLAAGQRISSRDWGL